jgi:23S rRNA pseudouridine2605 synthase
VLELTLLEGRNRQVRKMCDAIAHPVDRLRRTAIGPIEDRRLKPGQVRDLTPREVTALLGRDARGRSRPRPTPP